MKLIVSDSKPKLSQKDKDIFDRPRSKCVCLYEDRFERPVIISLAEDKPYPFRINIGMGMAAFQTLEEAEAFCIKRKFKKVN